MYDYSFARAASDKLLSEITPSPLSLAYSDTQFEILLRYIKDFEQSLDAEHEVGVLLTNFGQSVTMSVEQISYEEPVLLIFKGYVNGKMSTLIQHISQLNFLLMPVEKEPNRPKRTIGFVVPQP